MPPKVIPLLISASLAALTIVAPETWAQADDSPPAEPNGSKQSAEVQGDQGSVVTASDQTRQDLTYVRDAAVQAKQEQAELAEKLAALQARLAILEAELDATKEASSEASDPE